MQVNPTLLATALYRATKDKKNADAKTVAHTFVALLAQKGWIGMLPKIIEQLPAVFRAHNGETLVYIASAHPLSEKIQRLALGYLGLSPTDSTIVHTINPDLIAGIHIRTEEKMCDLSLRGRLALLRDTFHR